MTALDGIISGSFNGGGYTLLVTDGSAADEYLNALPSPGGIGDATGGESDNEDSAGALATEWAYRPAAVDGDGVAIYRCGAAAYRKVSTGSYLAA